MSPGFVGKQSWKYISLKKIINAIIVLDRLFFKKNRNKTLLTQDFGENIVLKLLFKIYMYLYVIIYICSEHLDARPWTTRRSK